MRSRPGRLFASRPQLGALGRLFRQRADGAGTPSQLTAGSLRQVYASGGEYPVSVSADGAKIIYWVAGTDSDGINDARGRPPQLLLDLPSSKGSRRSRRFLM